jgi:endoglucanase
MTPAQTVLPRWRGFNLLDFFTVRSNGDVAEDDFRWIAEWGFDFVRLPMCYTLWIEDGNPHRFHEPMLEKVDRAVELGRQYGLHVCLNFHRAPGYSVNPERREPYDLWKDPEALHDFCFHWRMFASRYAGVPSTELSFNLVNEPANPDPAQMTREDHARVMRAAVEAIRAVDPERLVILDGVNWGNTPCPELADLGVAQSCRAYWPMGVSHYRASWVNGETYPPPVWPGGWHYGQAWDREALERHYDGWAALAARGVGVHCGEGGAFNCTPHGVVLRWLRDVLEALQARGIGWALWNFRGGFGILDSERADVAYEDWRGHRLDRQMLELLRSH